MTAKGLSSFKLSRKNLNFSAIGGQALQDRQARADRVPIDELGSCNQVF